MDDEEGKGVEGGEVREDWAEPGDGVGDGEGLEGIGDEGEGGN